MNPTTLETSAAEVLNLERALKMDVATNHMPGISNYAVVSMNLLAATGIPQEQTLAAQASITAMALEDDPAAAKAIAKELAAAKVHHLKYRDYNRQIQRSLSHNISAEYQRSVTEAAARAESGDAGALDRLESEKDVETRFEAERDALQHAMKVSSHAMLPHALAIKPQIDGALAKLAKKNEALDLERCRKFGIAPEWSDTTRLIHSVRIQFLRRTADLRARHPSEACSPAVKQTYSDFLPELASW